jgi:hypothetical protein
MISTVKRDRPGNIGKPLSYDLGELRCRTPFFVSPSGGLQRALALTLRG